MTTLVIVGLLAAVGFLGMRLISARPEVKTFGLAQAQAAMQYITDQTQARTVLGVIVGVLGYQNTVTQDVSESVQAQEAAKTRRSETIIGNEQLIEELKAQIRGLRVHNSASDEEVAQLQRLAELFSQ